MPTKNRLIERVARRQRGVAYDYFAVKKLGSSEVKRNAYSATIRAADEIAGLLLKLLPLFPVLGGAILLQYLHNINRPELFISSIASPYGLVALFLGGALVLLVFVLTFIAPWGILSYVLMERGKHGLWKASTFKVMLTFSAFPALVMMSAMFGVSMPSKTYIAMGVVYLFSLLSLLPFSKSEGKEERMGVFERFEMSLEQNKAIFPLSIIMWLAALLCSFPIVVLVKLVDDEVIQILLMMGYVIFSAFLGIGLSKVRDWKVWTILGGAVLLIVILYMNDPVLSGAAKFLGIRHDDARWYSMTDSKKTQAVLPESIHRSVDGNYILAATPFSFGENVVICNSEESKIMIAECATLERSEVRLSGKDSAKEK